MDARDILRWFQNFRRGGTAPDSVKIKPLEEIVSRPVEHVAADAPQISLEVAEPKIELPPQLYGEALRRYMGIPDWFYDSQQELKRLGVHGEAQIAGARVSTPEQIRATYSRLEKIFDYDARSFVNYVPSAFTYKNSYLESYLTILRDVRDSLREKFAGIVPTEFDWKKNPALYSNIEGLVQIEARLKNIGKDESANQLAQNLEAYAGKKILLIGVRTERQEDIIRRYLPQSTLIFNRGEDIKGLTNELPDYDVIVITGGAATHKTNQILKSLYGADFGRRRVNAYSVVNPEKVLSIMAQNSHRFKLDFAT